MINNSTLLIDTEGFKVGQINGLTVMSIGDYSFGLPARITANTYVGKIMFRRAVPHRVVPCAQTAGKRDTDENRI